MSDPSPLPSHRLDGRRVLLTGASADSAIGRAIAVTLAARGAALALAGRRTEALEATRASLEEPERHVAAPVDLTDLDAIPGWMKGLAEAGGPFHGVVHSASVQGYSPLRGIDAAAFTRYFTLNVGAALLLARGFQAKGVNADGGALVLIGSAAGSKGQKGRALYAASKAALGGVVRSLALELADRRIRVNAVAPAVVAGAMAEKQFRLLAPEQNAALAAAHPLGFGQPEDVAATVAHLLADTGRWISGAVLPLDGGFTAG